jgi:hypothetical protein
MDIAKNLFKGQLKKNKKGKMVEGKSSMLHHCCAELKMKRNGRTVMDWR